MRTQRFDAKVDKCLAEVEMAGPYLPAAYAIWRAFELPLAKVRVLILGQDPCPNPDHAVGLSFSTGPGGAIPDSLTLPRDPTKRPRRHLRWWRPLAVAAAND